MSNKTSDENVANIERLNNFANMTFLYGNRVNLNVSALKEIQNDIKNILSDYTRQKQINEEHKKLNGELRERVKELEIKLKCAKDLYDDCCKCLLESIPKQVVIDKINEINKAYEESKDENGESPYYYPDYTVRVLQELLGGEKNNGNIKS